MAFLLKKSKRGQNTTATLYVQRVVMYNYVVERNYHELVVACNPCLIMIIPQTRLLVLIDVYFLHVKNKP